MSEPYSTKENIHPVSVVIPTLGEESLIGTIEQLYRGTRAIIMAMQAGLRPIYLQVPNEMTIDPLYEIDNKKIKVTTSLEFQNGITMHTDISQSTLINSEHLVKAYCENFFSPFDSSVLLNL